MSGSSGPPGSIAEFRNLQRITMSLIAGLRTLPGSGLVTRELWLYSKKGIWRYFRVTDSGIEEIGPDGEPLIPAGKSSAGAGAVTAS